MTTTQTPTPRPCLRCGRTLRSTKAVAEGMGRVCKAKVRAAAIDAAKARYADKPHLVAKAEEAIEAGGVALLRGQVCLVTGSKGDTYKAHPAACTCKAGLKAKHLCHHRIVADMFTATLAA